MYPNDGFRELGRQECLRLLGRADIGRIVHTRQALPAVLPVNFALDHDGAVLVRTAADSELVRAVDGAVVAFEGDEVDRAAESGWSVVVTGTATVVTDPAEQRRLAPLGPRSWAPSPREVLLRIEPELVTGRELVGGRTLYGVDVPLWAAPLNAERPFENRAVQPSGRGPSASGGDRPRTRK
ncbi:MAG: pyridoxamine 5'-phosphate oxidase family protein [Streptomyces sp.]|nr:pyridoxamine 5'-phosphate oxidase family protein [Streptomyces sp.]